MSSLLPPSHFLNQPHPGRPDFVVGAADGFVDTTTLAAHDFDVDTRTGFMPSHPPIGRLPIEWEPWETILDQARSMKLQLAVKPGLTGDEVAQSASWREIVRNNVSHFLPFPLMITRFTHIVSCICPYAPCDIGLLYPVTHAFNQGPYSLPAVTSASSSCAHVHHAHVYSHTPT